MTSEQDKKPGNSRRDLLIGLGALAAVAAGWQVWLKRPRKFEFEPLEGLPGWRRLVFEGISGGGNATNAVFAGLQDGSEPNVAALAPDRLCTTLFDRPRDKVPVAAFSDFFCPFCPRPHRAFA